MREILRIEDLKVYFYPRLEFQGKEKVIKAVDGVSLSLEEKETLALVGESGCGKTTVALSILRLLPVPPAKIEGGKIFFKGEDLLSLPEEALHRIRGKEISFIFQEPGAALDPLYRIEDQLGEAILSHKKLKKEELRKRCLELLRVVGIPSPERVLREYPHRLSGGMKQRILMGIALSLDPVLLIADEPTTALDVTVQAQILTLLLELKKKHHMSVLFITHDLGIVAGMAERVAVMYLGRLVEVAPVEEIFEKPLHPYTQLLLASLPQKRKKRKIFLSLPEKTSPSEGCRFYHRCPEKNPFCREEPPLRPIEKKHLVACFRR